MEYYVYEYLREDGTPYYVGKGARRRGKHNIAVPPKERVKFVAVGLTEQTAFDLEKSLILEYGPRNGPAAQSNIRCRSPGPELRKAQSERMKGITPWNKGKTMAYKQDRKWNRQGENHPQYNKPRSEDERRKISEGIKAKWDRPVLTCPHCSKQGKVGMTRWHFDHCKHRI